MLEEIAIGPVLTTQSGTQAVPQAAPPATGTSQGTTSSAYVSPPTDMNPEVGIVVIQYRNTSGNVEFSIPSKQQLDAYAATSLKGFDSDSTTV